MEVHLLRLCLLEVIGFLPTLSQRPITQNKSLVEVGQMGNKNGSWLVNLLVTLGY